MFSYPGTDVCSFSLIVKFQIKKVHKKIKPVGAQKPIVLGYPSRDRTSRLTRGLGYFAV